MSEGNTVLDTNDYCLAKDDSDRWMVLSCFREGLDESIKFKLYPRCEFAEILNFDCVEFFIIISFSL